MRDTSENSDNSDNSIPNNIDTNTDTSSASTNMLVRVDPVEPGNNCSNGGQVILTGIDLNSDTILDDEEITSRAYVCNGANGVDGVNGEDGRDGENGQDGEDGRDGENGQDGEDASPGQISSTYPVLGLVAYEQLSYECENSSFAMQVSRGYDTNNNQTLDLPEIFDTQYICFDDERGPFLVQTLEANECESGGQMLYFGYDDNDSQELDEEEIQNFEFMACNQNLAIANIQSLTKARWIDDDEECENALGYLRVSTGLDRNLNNTLDDTEITYQTNVCLPSNESNGTNGKNSLVILTSLESGFGNDCQNGGYRVDTGLDVNNNEQLDEDEINDSYTACNALGAEVAEPVISLAAGTYENSAEVTLSVTTPDAEIYYTLDGSTPTSDSYLYSGPITLSENAHLKAIALRTDRYPSTVASRIYKIRKKFYVSSATGSDSNNGSQNAPFQSILRASLEASEEYPHNLNEIYVAEGTYSENDHIVLAGETSVFGGYDPAHWENNPDVQNHPTIVVDNNPDNEEHTEPQRYTFLGVFVFPSNSQGSLSGFEIHPTEYRNYTTYRPCVSANNATVSVSDIVCSVPQSDNGSTNGYGISFRNSTASLVNSEVNMHCTWISQTGVFIDNSTVEIKRINVRIFSGTGYDYGILATSSSHVTLDNSLINTNVGSGVRNVAVSLDDNSSLIAYNNTIRFGHSTWSTSGEDSNPPSGSTGIGRHYAYASFHQLEAKNNIVFTTYSEDERTRCIDLGSAIGTVTYNNLFGCYARMYTSPNPDNLTQNNNLNVNLITGDNTYFVNEDSDLHLEPNSGFAGVTGGLVLDSAYNKDLDGTTRTHSDEEGWSMGCYEADPGPPL